MAGDSFELFFKENENTLYKIIKSYVRSADIAKDIVLETMMKIYERWDNVKYFENSVGYAVRIGINMAKKKLMENKIKTFLPILREDDNPDLASDVYNPESSVLKAEEDAWLEQELYNLKEIERNIIILKDIDKKKFDEIAEIFNQKLSTIKSHYRRGKIKLSRKMEEIYE